jgi:hypothetical protein
MKMGHHQNKERTLENPGGLDGGNNMRTGRQSALDLLEESALDATPNESSRRTQLELMSVEEICFARDDPNCG